MSSTSQDNTKRSRPHRRIEKLLDELRINYESEWGEFVPYALDIWVPEWWCAIEVDGPSHSKRKDALRDAALRDVFGIEVLHLNVAGYFDNDMFKIQILAFFKRIAESASKRRELHRSRQSG